MATVERRGDVYQVGWFEPVTIAGVAMPEGKGWKPVKDGAGAVLAWKKFHHRGRSFPSKADAEQYRRDIETLLAKGDRPTRKIDLAVATIRQIVDAYAEAPANDRTRKWRRSTIGLFATWAGTNRPVTDLSGDLLEAFAATLPSAGRKEETRYRRLLAIEAMWKWAAKAERREKFPGVPEPMRITSDGHDVNASVQPAPPVVRVAVPDMEDLDKMLAHIRPGWTHGDASRRVAVLCRYTGIRIAQAVNLVWKDVRLDYPAEVAKRLAGPYIVIRPQTRGTKKATRTRVVPIHPALLAEMLTWGPREGTVFPAENERWVRGETAREAFRTAWKSAGVSPEKWDVPDIGEEEEGNRGHGSPTHAIRSAVFTHLLREGVSFDLAEYVIGHSTSATRGAYVPEAAPETAPIWAFLHAAVRKIPAHDPSPPKIVRTRKKAI